MVFMHFQCFREDEMRRSMLDVAPSNEGGETLLVRSMYVSETSSREQNCRVKPIPAAKPRLRPSQPSQLQCIPESPKPKAFPPAVFPKPKNVSFRSRANTWVTADEEPPSEVVSRTNSEAVAAEKASVLFTPTSQGEPGTSTPIVSDVAISRGQENIYASDSLAYEETISTEVRDFEVQSSSKEKKHHFVKNKDRKVTRCLSEKVQDYGTNADFGKMQLMTDELNKVLADKAKKKNSTTTRRLSLINEDIKKPTSKPPPPPSQLQKENEANENGCMTSSNIVLPKDGQQSPKNIQRFTRNYFDNQEIPWYFLIVLKFCNFYFYSSRTQESCNSKQVYTKFALQLFYV